VSTMGLLRKLYLGIKSRGRLRVEDRGVPRFWGGEGAA